MTEKQNDFVALIILAFKREVIKKLVFSKPQNSEVSKVSCRLCAHRGRRILAAEYTLEDTVAQRNFREESLEDELPKLMERFNQVNLITTLKDAEWKRSKSGNEVILGYDALKRALSGTTASFVSAVEALDKSKNYILSGNEQFLKALEISDKNGRVHDKKQGKFRQINRFLEHIEDIYSILPKDKEITIYDLCSGKSYLSFAVYHYLTVLKERKVNMLCIDLKEDVISWCERLASELKFSGMRFICDDIRNTPRDVAPDMVISLHACDTATDTVIDTAISLGAKIILSTPCCHRYLNDKISQSALKFVTDYPQLKNKLCEAITDAIRLARLKSNGYKVSALELTDPENTPKNTLLRAVFEGEISESERQARNAEYESILNFVLGDKRADYLK